MTYTDDKGTLWSIEEHFFNSTSAGVLFFSAGFECRAIWGSPIAWHNPENLKTLFALSVVIPRASQV
jgi:hypothetical protein